MSYCDITHIETDGLNRDQPMMRPRRESRTATSFRPSSLLASAFRKSETSSRGTPRGGWGQQYRNDEDDEANDRTPLMRSQTGHTSATSRYGADPGSNLFTSHPRRASAQTSSQCSPGEHWSPAYTPDVERDFDVNNPPSIPGSPQLGPEMNYDDAVVTGADFDFSVARSAELRRNSLSRLNDAVINIEHGAQHSAPSSIRSGHVSPKELRRRRTVALPVEEDVCFPIENISELGGEEPRIPRDGERRRRRHRQWPDLSVLEEWSREEKEDRNGDLRVKKISEPVLIEGRLRPQYKLWRREEDDAPYRFTYFNEEFQSTIHAQTISELVQPGSSFKELFIPDPPELEDSSDDEDLEGSHSATENNGADHWGPSRSSNLQRESATPYGHSGTTTPVVPNNRNGNDYGQNTISGPRTQPRLSVLSDGRAESQRETSPVHSNGPQKPKRYGPRPTFWLDVLSPTDAEMRTIAKAFGIHALTAEDIMMQEAREKVELFRSYYFVNYRTFEQDTNSEDYLEPVNMYVVVFREGVLSFHFSQTPHPANVRRRIRQLMDYLILSSDWISYALIDDITDVFGPLIQAIEDEVDEVDEIIMQMHSSSKEESSAGSVQPSFSPGEMLRRTGDCRKKVMGLYRLLSNKADVVKGFAKRCNEQWEVAPKSEIGLYLGDIQDHIMTMTGNLTYYET